MRPAGTFSGEDLTVYSISEYENAIARLRRENLRATLFFRGQTTDRPLTASIHRPDADEDPLLIPDVHYSWSEFAANALSFIGHRTHRRSRSVMAILQHYGSRSHFLDVTHNPAVALWFSLHRFLCHGTMLFDETDDPHLIFHPLINATYVRSKSADGFVYVIAVPSSLRRTHLIDLERSMPKSVLRVHRQRAALLSNRDSQFDWNIHVVARLRIAAPLTQLVFPHELSFGWLFPTPDEDALYRELIRVPFYVPFGNTNNPIEVNPLLLIPYYFGSFVERSSRKNASDNVVAMLKHLLVT